MGAPRARRRRRLRTDPSPPPACTPPLRLHGLIWRLCSQALLSTVPLPLQGAWCFPPSRASPSASGASRRSTGSEGAATPSAASPVAGSATASANVSSLLSLSPSPPLLLLPTLWSHPALPLGFARLARRRAPRPRQPSGTLRRPPATAMGYAAASSPALSPRSRMAGPSPPPLSLHRRRWLLRLRRPWLLLP
jgi:hypothetical protein